MPKTAQQAEARGKAFPLDWSTQKNLSLDIVTDRTFRGVCGTVCTADLLTAACALCHFGLELSTLRLDLVEGVRSPLKLEEMRSLSSVMKGERLSRGEPSAVRIGEKRRRVSGLFDKYNCPPILL